MQNTAFVRAIPVSFPRCLATRLATGLALVLLTVSAASAQTRVRVTQDQTVIWEAGFAIIAGTVQKGVELEVVGKRDTWYEVTLPFRSTSGRTTGYVAASRVEAIASDGAGPAIASGGAAPVATAPEAPFEPRAGGRVFGQVGYDRFMAEQTFSAVLGNVYGGVAFGGGAEYHTSSGAFIQVAAEQFRATGDQVTVVNGDVVKPGGTNTITVVPVTFTLGYRGRWRGVFPYLGAGYGRYMLQEDVEPAPASGVLKEQYNGYHVVGGMEAGGGLFGVGFEVEYSHVPNAFVAGTGALFDEHNLGAFRARVKVFFGRAR